MSPLETLGFALGTSFASGLNLYATVVGVRITLDKFLATFEPVGLVRRGGSYLSPGYDQAAGHKGQHVTTAVGGVTVEWLAGER